MQLPSMLQGDSLKRLLQGAAAGAVATMVVGFNWGGWSLGSTAAKMAKERSELAVITVLAPVCADKFRALPDAEAKQVALSKAESWKRGDELPKELVTLPGESYPAPPLRTRAPRCCLHRSRPRSNKTLAQLDPTCAVERLTEKNNAKIFAICSRSRIDVHSCVGGGGPRRRRKAQSALPGPTAECPGVRAILGTTFDNLARAGFSARMGGAAGCSVRMGGAERPRPCLQI